MDAALRDRNRRDAKSAKEEATKLGDGPQLAQWHDQVIPRHDYSLALMTTAPPAGLPFTSLRAFEMMPGPS